jgi:hypothetical protein
MIYLVGTKLTCVATGENFVVTESDATLTHYRNATHNGHCMTDALAISFIADREPIAPEAAPSALDTQVGGDHYKRLGDYQPWQVLKAWLTPEEFRGYMKGTAIAYLAREQQKGGDQDIEKAAHTLEGLIEMGSN